MYNQYLNRTTFLTFSFLLSHYNYIDSLNIFSQ